MDAANRNACAIYISIELSIECLHSVSINASVIDDIINMTAQEY